MDGSGFMGCGLLFVVYCLWFMGSGLWFMVKGSGFKAQGAGSGFQRVAFRLLSGGVCMV